MTDFEFMRDKDNVKIGITFAKDGEETEMEAEGNGSLNAINNALRAYTGAEYTLQVFTQHSMQDRARRAWRLRTSALKGRRFDVLGRRHRHRRCKGEYKGAVERLQQYDQRGKLK